VDGRAGVKADGLRYIAFDPLLPAGADGDSDGLPVNWEGAYGLSDTDATDAALDADGDGRTNAQEYADGTHPRGFYTRYLAEGASSDFFTTRVVIANPNAAPATVLFRALTDRGETVPRYLVLPALSRQSVVVNDLFPNVNVAFASVIESDVEVVVDRTMLWGASGFGSSAETSVPAPALQWFLAEGATHGAFDLFYLLQNPDLTQAAQVRIRYLTVSGAPIERTYTVAPRSRHTIQVDAVPGLASAEVSAVIESLNNVPIIAERAMYVFQANVGWIAGHESAGVTAPSSHWFLAEGATGPLFDLFVLYANPSPQPADLRVTYLLENGTNIVVTRTIPGNARRTVNVALEDPRLAQTTVATTVESLNGVPIVVERAMWWPHGQAWTEGHNSAGSTATGVKWGLGDGGSTPTDPPTWTYVLIANTARTPATVRVTLLFADRGPVSRDVSVLPNARKTIDLGIFPESAGRTYSVVVESLTGEPIVVERAMYSNAGGVTWAAGTNALATRLR
jgi:hypothetical protein